MPDIDFTALRKHVKEQGVELDDELEEAQRSAAQSDSTQDSYYYQRDAVEEKIEEILEVLGKAKGAQTTGEIERRDFMLEKAEGKLALLGGGTFRFIDCHPVLELPPPAAVKSATFIEGLDNVVHVASEVTGQLSAIWERDILARLPGPSKYSKLRVLAGEKEGERERLHNSNIRSRTNEAGYETDTTGLANALGAQYIEKEFEEIDDLIDRAEAAEKAGNKAKARNLFLEVWGKLNS